MDEGRRSQAETEARLASEDRLRSVFDSLEDAFCILELLRDERGDVVDYRFVEANPAFETHTGIAQAKGRCIRETHPDLEQTWFETYGKVAETGVPARFDARSDAFGRHFEAYATRVGGPGSALVAVLFRDISARKQADAEREELLAREQLARQQAEAASQLRDEFLSAVSHELRTPLNSMLGWVQMLRLGRLDDAKRNHALEVIERNVRAQTALIADLLDVSSILAGRVRLASAPVDLCKAVEAAFAAVVTSASANQITIQANLNAVPKVAGDSKRIEQIVVNLLSNAVKFTPKGGAVEVSLSVERGGVVLSVHDTGRGIAPEFLPFVFDRFRQAQGGTTRRHGGLGLGLAIVRQLAELHGGRVEVSSEGEGKGATFRVWLPALDAVVSTDGGDANGAPGIPAPELTLSGLEVLLVEDEQDTREMVASLLEQFGAVVRQSERAAQAYGMFEARPPHVLLSDIGMPEEDGYSFVSRIRKLPAGSSLPVVALTAYADETDRLRALAAGFSHWLAKPVEPSRLLSLLSSLRGQAAPLRE